MWINRKKVSHVFRFTVSCIGASKQRIGECFSRAALTLHHLRFAFLWEFLNFFFHTMCQVKSWRSTARDTIYHLKNETVGWMLIPRENVYKFTFFFIVWYLFHLQIEFAWQRYFFNKHTRNEHHFLVKGNYCWHIYVKLKTVTMQINNWSKRGLSSNDELKEDAGVMEC